MKSTVGCELSREGEQNREKLRGRKQGKVQRIKSSEGRLSLLGGEDQTAEKAVMLFL